LAESLRTKPFQFAAADRPAKKAAKKAKAALSKKKIAKKKSRGSK